MNLLIAIVVILCLLLSESKLTTSTMSSTEDIWLRIVAMILVTLTVPGIAIFQTAIVRRNLLFDQLTSEKKEASYRRLFFFHSAIWLAASLMIILSLNWHSIVRFHWGLSQVPLIDECLILLPIVLSLIASWWVFFDIRSDSNEKNWYRLSHWFSSSRWDFVLLRCRVYLVMTLLPLSVFVFLRDIATLYPNSTWTVLVYGLTSVGIFLGFPFIISFAWNLTKDDSLTKKLDLPEFCKRHKLRISGLRIWKTGNQICNAMVAGFLPYFRLIVVTDGMLNRFPTHELNAILRHEAGHIRQRHLLIRVGVVLFPVMFFGIADQMGLSITDKLNGWFQSASISTQLGTAVVCGFYLAFLVTAISWLSRKMEYDADLYAVSEAEDLPHQDACNHLLDALIRFASQHPEHIDRPTLLHPSLRERMQQIVQVRNHPDVAESFRTSWRKQQIYFLLTLVAFCCAVAAA